MIGKTVQVLKRAVSYFLKSGVIIAGVESARRQVSANQIKLDSEEYKWLKKDRRREKLLLSFIQPMTSRQLSRCTGINLEACSSILKKLSAYGLSNCLNPCSQRSKLYDLTDSGISFQRRIATESGDSVDYWFDWEIYGKLCFSQRSAVLQAWKKQDEPLQAITIKRRAKENKPSLRMSANNVRDILRFLSEMNLVKTEKDSKERFPRYTLGDVAWIYRLLLLRVERLNNFI